MLFQSLKITKVKGECFNNNDEYYSEKKIPHSYLLENKKNLSSLP